MNVTNFLIETISEISPYLGSLLGGPSGTVVGSLISKALGGIDMSDESKVRQALSDPGCARQLKELELQLTDLQNARLQAAQDKGYLKLVRPFLAVLSMVAIFFDIYAIEFVKNEILKDILIFMLVCLVWDVRQTYKFYFGSSEDLPNIPFINQKK